MATPHASAAPLATALVDAKLAPHGLAGQVGLELFVDVVVLVKLATTMRTDLGQDSLERFVDGFGRRRSMGMSAMLGAGLSTGFFGLQFGRALGERAGLALAGTFLVVEPLFQLGDASLEFSDLAIAFAATRAWRMVHGDSRA